jgi:hypothetical protein
MLPQNVTVGYFCKRKLLENRKGKTHETSWNVEIPQEAYGCFKLND